MVTPDTGVVPVQDAGRYDHRRFVRIPNQLGEVFEHRGESVPMHVPSPVGLSEQVPVSTRIVASNRPDCFGMCESPMCDQRIAGCRDVHQVSRVP